MKKHAQNQQPLVDRPKEGKQPILKESPRSVALPLRLRGTPKAPMKPEVPSSSERWGKSTLQSLGIRNELPLTIADGGDMFPGEVTAGATHKLAAELDNSVGSSEGCSLHKERSPPSPYGDDYPFLQGPKVSCLSGSGDSFPQPPRPAEDDETSPCSTMRDPWLTSNVRQPMQPPVPSFSGPASPKVSEQTLRDSGLTGVWPRSRPIRGQQAGKHPADPSVSQCTAFRQVRAADRQKGVNVYAPTPTHIQRQEVEGDICRPDLYHDTNPRMQLQGPASTNVAEVQAGGNHAQETYNMQLMLLEQQNKKRLLKARQEHDAVDIESDGQAAIKDAIQPKKHHLQTELQPQQPQQQPSSVQHFAQQQPQQTDPQKQQSDPVLLSAKEQWQWLRGRTNQHFQHLLTSAAQKYGDNPAAVPPSVRLDCLQRAKVMAEEQLPLDYIMKCGPETRDPKQMNQGLPDNGTQAEPQSKSSSKAEFDTLEPSKVPESKRTRQQRHQSQQGHKMVAGCGEPRVSAYRCMAANAFDQDRERRERKNFNLFTSLEPDFKSAQDRLLMSTEAHVQYMRYPGFCDAVNRLRDQQRRTFDEALAEETNEKGGRVQGAARVKEQEVDQGDNDKEEACAKGVAESRLRERSLAQHAPTLAPAPMRWTATTIAPLSGKVSPRLPSHTATQHSSAEGRSVKTSDEKKVERKAAYKSWVAEGAEKLRKQAQKVAADKAEELRKQYEAESKTGEPKPTFTIPEQQPRTWIYRHGAYTFHERAVFIQYRHGYIYLRNIAAGVSMLARHLRCFGKVDIEHVEQLTGLCLDHFKPDSPRMWTLGHESDTVTIEARFLDYRDGYVNLEPTGAEGVKFVHKRIQDFNKGDMKYIGGIRSRDFEMSRAMPGDVEEGGRGHSQGGRAAVVDKSKVEKRDQDTIEAEVGVEAQDEVEDKDNMDVENKDKMEVEVEDTDKMEVENKDKVEVEHKNKMEVEDKDKMEVEHKDKMEVEVEEEAKAPNDTSAPLSEDGDMEWHCVDEMMVSSEEESWTEVDEEMVVC